MMKENLAIRIRGFRSAQAVDAVFASRLVDIAYVDKIFANHIFVATEPNVDLSNHEDFVWVESIIQRTLADVGEIAIIVDIVRL